MDTAGRAVLFAGATVIIALLGQFALGINFLNGMAIASALAVLLTMLAALTVLPALLSRFGERLGRRARERVNAGAGMARRGALGALVGLHRAPPVGGHGRGPRHHARARLARAGAAHGQQRRRQRPGRQDDPHGLRPARARASARGFNGPLQIVASLPQANDRRGAREHRARRCAAPPTSPRSPPRASTPTGRPPSSASSRAPRRSRRRAPTW